MQIAAKIFYGKYAAVDVLVKSKRTTTGAPDGVPVTDAPDEDDGCANCHWRAAFNAAAAKNSLEAGLASSAEETVPSGFNFTRTLIRTVPRMVERDLSETSGNTLRMIEGGAGFAPEAAGREADAAGGTADDAPDGAVSFRDGRAFAFDEDELAPGNPFTEPLPGFPFGVDDDEFAA